MTFYANLHIFQVPNIAYFYTLDGNNVIKHIVFKGNIVPVDKNQILQNMVIVENVYTRN